MAERRLPALGLAALALAPALALAEPPAARQVELIYRLRQDCGSCHGLTLKGGLGPALLPATLAGRDAESLAEVVTGGIPGTPMPPWAFEIAPDEAVWLVRRLQEGRLDAAR